MNKHRPHKLITSKHGQQTKLILTLREEECLAKVSRGKNANQIANELSINTKTVYYYLNSIQMKLNKLCVAISTEVS